MNLTIFIFIIFNGVLQQCQFILGSYQSINPISSIEFISGKNSIHENIEQFTIKFIRSELEYNNHVGNEWVIYTEINGNRIFEGGEFAIKVEEGDSITLTSFLYETNEKHIDSNYESYSISYSELKSLRGKGFSTEVIITESNGRYAGNSAMMKFYYQVE